jgi:hypothetical protein
LKKTEIIVAGGGFSGIYAAWRLAKEGKKVCLIDASDSLGGNMKSRQWNGYWIDSGMHNLDMRSDAACDFFTDILQDELILLEDHDWASTTSTTYTPGFEMPDFSNDNPQLAHRALNELTQLENLASANDPDFSGSEETYLNWYENNYGASLCAVIKPMLKKLTGGHTDTVSAAGRSALSIFSRPKLGEDIIMSRLKASSDFLDDRIGVTCMGEDTRFSGQEWMTRFGYPAKGGLGGFCKRSELRLRELGVDIQFDSKIQAISSSESSITVNTSSQTIEGVKLLWTLSDQQLSDALSLPVTINSSLLPVGYCIFAFEVLEHSILGPDYLHDFKPERLPYRYSKPGVYSRQTSEDGHTVILAEVPSHPSDQASLLCSKTTQKVWSDCQASGYIEEKCSFKDSTSWSVPVAFALPAASWTTRYANLKQRLETDHPGIIAINSTNRARSAFINSYESTLQQSFA